MAEAVKVIVRCRPMNTREKDLKCKEIIAMNNSRGQCSIRQPKDAKAPPKDFTFDGAYFTDSTTEQIYADIGYELVEGVTVGFNGTIFAYGQTGCGKSFSMQGITIPATQRGIIPRAFDHIFETISVTEDTKFLVHASYLEIYNEEIRDLLAKDTKQKLDLKEHPEKGVYVSGLSTHTVHNVSDCEKVMDKGWNNRSTGATLMNADSSRSHSIFTIHLEMSKVGEDGEDHIRVGKLNLVDLAGSERQGKTGATGDRLKEATKINLSLSALGNVISALVDGKSKHIPYRDSKLTRLLQDSLGGNTKTLMVACLSPADNNYEETLSTLRYANRAKNIKNKPKINEDPKDALLREYQEEIMKLKAMLMGQMAMPEGGFANMDLSKLGAISASQVKPKPSIEEKVIEKIVTVKDEIAIEEEKARIKQEYEEQLSEMKAKYEAEKISQSKLKRDMEKLRQYYDSKARSVDGASNIPLTEEGVSGEENGAVEPNQELGHRQESPSDLLSVSGRDTAEETGTDPTRLTPVPAVRQKSSLGDETAGVEGPAAVNGQKPGPEQEGEGVDPQVVSGVPQVKEPGGDEQGDPEADNNGEQLSDEQAEMLRSESRGDVLNQMEALERLQELQEQMVGGENVNNREVKERRKKKKKHVEDRNKKLAAALAGEEDEIMIGIYENVHDELKAMKQKFEKEKEKGEGWKREISDQASEFEFDRIDYLDTIRRQDQQMKLLQGIIDRIHPCIRRDCNYTNLDRVKNECKWDEEEQKWFMPQLMVEKTSLPTAGFSPGGISAGGRESNRRAYGQHSSLRQSPPENDPFYQKLQSREEDASRSYFKSNRQIQLLGQAESSSASWPGTGGRIGNGGATSPMNGGGRYEHQPFNNGVGHPDHRAAMVHGTLGGGSMGVEEAQPPISIPMRKPGKLESIRLASAGKKNKKVRHHGRQQNWSQMDD